MSDFLTNLVMRSFSRTASVQPVGTTAYPGPEMLRDPVEQFADPFAEEPLSEEAEEQTVPPSNQEPANRSLRIESAPTANDREPFAAAQLADRGVSPAAREIPSPPESPTHVQRQSRESSSELNEPFSVSKTSTTETSLTAPLTKSIETSRPSRQNSRQTPRDRDASLLNQEPNAAPSLELGTSTESAPTKGILQKRATSNATSVAPISHHVPVDPQPSVRRLMKRRANAISLSPKASSSHLEPAGPRRTQKTDTPAVESAGERTPLPLEERQQTITSFTTLIPKTSTQPLLPVNIKSRPDVHTSDVRDEAVTDAPSHETVINVAIGRIEVRATSAPAAKRERQTSGPKVMNLDDYMQQRSRGGK
jgi:hypothetical protein